MNSTPHNPAERAFAIFAEQVGHERSVAIIEGGYFDPRELTIQTRERQLRDSFRLQRRLGDLPAHHRPEVGLTALVNDFQSRLCGLESCDHTEVPDHELSRPVPVWASTIYRNESADSEDAIKLFLMKRTRNRVARRLRRLLMRENDCGLSTETDGEVSDIYIDTEVGRVPLASFRKGHFEFSVRCTALMAQHYFDLLNYAQSRFGDFDVLWLFDFLHYLERGRVAAGIAASFSLFQWPTSVRIAIANTIYGPDEDSQSLVDLTEWP